MAQLPDGVEARLGRLRQRRGAGARRRSTACGSCRARRTATTPPSTPRSAGRSRPARRCSAPAAASSTRCSRSPAGSPGSRSAVHAEAGAGRRRAGRRPARLQPGRRGADGHLRAGHAARRDLRHRAVHRLPLVQLRPRGRVRRAARGGRGRRLGPRARRRRGGDRAAGPPVLRRHAVPAAGRRAGRRAAAPADRGVRGGAAAWSAADIPDQSGRRARSSRARTAALGLVAARELARRGAARRARLPRPARGEAALLAIRDAVPDGDGRSARRASTSRDLGAGRAFAGGRRSAPIDLLDQQRRRDGASRAATTADGFELAARHEPPRPLRAHRPAARRGCAGAQAPRVVTRLERRCTGRAGSTSTTCRASRATGRWARRTASPSRQPAVHARARPAPPGAAVVGRSISVAAHPGYAVANVPLRPSRARLDRVARRRRSTASSRRAREHGRAAAALCRDGPGPAGRRARRARRPRRGARPAHSSCR